MVEAAERREKARRWYDHYRIKTAKLKTKEDKQKSGFACGPSGDRERTIRNMEKLANAETDFKL